MMNTKEYLLLAIQELIDETFGKPNHYIWLNGKAMDMYEEAKEFGNNRIIQAAIAFRLSKLTKEFEDTKALVPMYSKFGG